MTRLASPPPAHRLGTLAVHAGPEPDPVAGAVMPPIYQTSTYIQDGLERPHHGYEYARTSNPTRQALERALATLEGGTHGFAFGSGLAALDAVLKLLRPGDHVVAGENLYGGSHRQMVRIFAEFGVAFDFVDLRDVDAVRAAFRPATRMLYAETPTNPMMFLADLAALGDLAQARGAIFVVDNTFATPVLQRPLTLGADIVLHSTTKYLNGHSDMVGGALVTSRDDLAEKLGFLQNAVGAVPGPFDCWLVLRGLKTLPLRMRQHCDTADLLPRTAESPAARPCPPADDGVRRHGLDRTGLGRADAEGGAPLPPLRAGRVARRGRVAAGPPGLDDPCLGAAGDAATDGAHRLADPALGGDRGCGRPDCGP